LYSSSIGLGGSLGFLAFFSGDFLSSGLSEMDQETSLSRKNLDYTAWIEKRFSSGKFALME
jgi:hypothetical protein